MLLTCSKMRAGVLETGSLTTHCNVMMLVPPLRFSRILISRLIFFFLTGFKVLTTHFSLFTTLMASNTSLYLPRPSFLTSCKKTKHYFDFYVQLLDFLKVVRSVGNDRLLLEDQCTEHTGS